MREAQYPIAPRGLATSFTESEVPPEYALRFRNRFINAAGGAEKRQGISQLGDDVPGLPNLTGVHELVKKDGAAELFVSGAGKIYKIETSAWSEVHDAAVTGRLRSVQMGEKLIFVTGSAKPFYTKDGSEFKSLNAVILRGDAATGSDQDSLLDADVGNWVNDTDVVVNDLLYNATKDAYAIITAVVSGSVSHTNISSSAAGIGITTATAQESGDKYEIYDLVELNIVPTDTVDDNVATASVGTSVASIVVSAVTDWTATDIRIGDYIRNTTRAAVTEVTSVSTARIGVKGITGQTDGDSLVFLKPAMPYAANAHVHFGRLYLVDDRDQRLVRISGANNPEDFTTDAGTLDSTTFKYGEQQPLGDTVQDMASFQRFFAIAGKKNLFLFQGTDPIADTSAQSVDFDIIGLFPQGVVSRDSLISIGNDLVFVTPDGVQTTSLVGDASTLGRANISEALKTTLRDALQATSEDDIQVLHYPRRSWFLLRVGTQIFVFNYTAFFGDDSLSQRAGGTLSAQDGSWSEFDGKLAQQNAWLVRRNSDMVLAGAGGKVYRFDQGGFSDDGDPIPTAYQTGWLTLKEPRRDVKTKDGKYIRPTFESGGETVYTITAEAGFGAEATETIDVTAVGGATIGAAVIGTDVIGGSPIEDTKYSLRWRGKECRITFTTDDTVGPDTLSRFVLYVNDFGRR